MTRTIAYLADSGTICPHCGKTLHFRYQMRAGTTFTQFIAMPPEDRRAKSLAVEEVCRCGYTVQVE